MRGTLIGSLVKGNPTIWGYFQVPYFGKCPPSFGLCGCVRTLQVAQAGRKALQRQASRFLQVQRLCAIALDVPNTSQRLQYP